MPLKHAESRAIQPLFRRYRVWRCSPLFSSVVLGKGKPTARFKRNHSHLEKLLAEAFVTQTDSMVTNFGVYAH